MKNDFKKGDMVVIIGNKGPLKYDQLIGWFGTIIQTEDVHFTQDRNNNIVPIVAFWVQTKNKLDGDDQFLCLRSELLKINPGTLQIKRAKARTKENCLE